MGLLKRRTVLAGLSSLLVVSSTLFADAVVDEEFDNNENEFEYYWYYFDDNAGLSVDDRPTAGTGTKPSVINVVTTKKAREAYPGDTYQMNDYTFTPGSDALGKFASMPFTMGDEWEASYGTTLPFVGMGTMLAETGKSIDLTGATSVSFKAKSGVAATLTIKFKVQTLQIDQYSEVKVPPKGAFAYYEKAVTITNQWDTYVVNIADLALPTWATGANNHRIPFDITKATKLAWEIQQKDNTDLVTDELGIDAITIIGTYTYVSPTLWTQNASMDLPAIGLFSNFEGTDPQASPLGYWYAYNDAAISGSSTVTAGATQNETTKLLNFSWTDQTGSGNVGKGAMLGFALGPTVKQGVNDVQGFVGIGVNVYDSTDAVYWNASAAGASSIYFHYLLDADAKWVTLEISDINDVGDKNEPGRKDTRGSGVVWYINLPPTGDSWKAVEIPFSALVYHSGWKGSQNIPLNLSKLAKIQWKVQGAPGKEGVIMIDNVCFPGVTKFELPLPGAVVNKLGRNQASDFRADYLNGNIHINWTNKTAVSNGSMSLVNTQGKVIATAPMAITNKFSTDFSAKKLPAGMYFVRMNAVNVNGNAVVSQSAITIVK